MRIVLASFALIGLTVQPAVNSSSKKEISEFCRRTNNYQKCINEFIGHEKAKLRLRSNQPIEIEVIPYKEKQ